MSETEVGFRLAATIEKNSIIRGGRTKYNYTAKCGAVEVTENTKADATVKLAEATKQALENWGNPVVLWSFDKREAWIAFPTPSGWGYAIIDADRPCMIRDGYPIYQNGGAWATRAECLEHMRQHWSDLNVMPIVLGIIGLCTERRQWVCRRCNCCTQAAPPYICQNPACNALFQE